MKGALPRTRGDYEHEQKRQKSGVYGWTTVILNAPPFAAA